MSNSTNNPNKQRNILLVIIAILVLFLIGLLVVVFFGGKSPEESVPTTEPVVEAPTTLPTEPPTEPSTEAPTEETTEAPEPAPTEPGIHPELEALHKKNRDVVGWVKIEGTKIDYPFVHTPKDYDKYLHMDLNGNYSYAGAIIMDQRCTTDPESDNVILHGHNMKNGTMFNNIMKYVKKSYWKKHPTVYYSNLEEEREYEIIAVFYDKVYNKKYTGFKFYEFTDPKSEKEFNNAIKYFKKNSLYDTGLTAEYGDRLLMLVTCSYHIDDGRLVVVAREITDNKD